MAIPLSYDQFLVDALTKLVEKMQTVSLAIRSKYLCVAIAFRITALYECSSSDLFLSQFE